MEKSENELDTIINDLVKTYGKDGAVSFLENLKYGYSFLNDKNEINCILADFQINDFFTNIPKLSRLVKSFLTELLKNDPIESVLDPYMHIGELLGLIEEIHPKAYKKGYTQLQDQYEFCNISKFEIDAFKGNFNDVLEVEKNRNYDLIISNLPVGLKAYENYAGLARSDAGLQYVLKSLSLLNEHGQIIFTVSSQFFFTLNSHKFHKIVNEYGFSIDAIFGFPVQSFNQYASVPIYLVVISKGKQKDIFLADLDEQSNVHSIVNHYRNHANAPREEDGLLVSLEELEPIEKIKAKRDIVLSIKRLGIPLHRFSTLGKFKKPSEIQGAFIAIPRLGRKAIVLGNVEDFSVNDHLFFEVNPDKVEVQYLIHFLNAPLGRKLMAYIAQGAVQPMINKQTLLEIDLPLPDPLQQTNILELTGQLNTVAVELAALKASLWERPGNYGKVARSLKDKINTSDNINLLNRLPFPLASIIWGFRSANDIRKQQEYLFNFFEGLGQFLDTLILSALVTEKDYFMSTARHWIAEEDMKDWPKRPSFGSWIALLSNLSKNLRRLYNDKYHQEFVLNLFSNPGNDFFEFIISKQLVHTLQQVNVLRNNVKGHGGVLSDTEVKRHNATLEEAFGTLLMGLSAAFSNIHFIKPLPQQMNYDDDIRKYSSNCYQISGTSDKFNEDFFLTDKPLDSKRWYMIVDNGYKAIRMLPYVSLRFVRDSSQLACYFYNRISSKDEVRYVSYHHEAKPDFEEADQKFRESLYYLNPVEE